MFLYLCKKIPETSYDDIGSKSYNNGHGYGNNSKTISMRCDDVNGENTA